MSLWTVLAIVAALAFVAFLLLIVACQAATIGELRQTNRRHVESNRALQQAAAAIRDSCPTCRALRVSNEELAEVLYRAGITRGLPAVGGALSDPDVEFLRSLGIDGSGR